MLRRAVHDDLHRPPALRDELFGEPRLLEILRDGATTESELDAEMIKMMYDVPPSEQK